MSKHIVSLVYRKKIGSMMRKAVLSYMADRANDDGTGVWCSKATIANEIEASRQGVISTIKGLLEDGILIEDGKRKCSNGFTIEYRIDLQKVHALPFVTGKNMDGSKSVPVKQADVAPSTTFTSHVSPVDPNLPKPPLEPKGSSDDASLALEEIWKAWSKTGLSRSKSKALCTDLLKRISKTHDLRAIVRAARMYAKTTEGGYHKGLHTWLSGGFYENWMPRDMGQATAEPVDALEFCFEAFAKTGEWYGDRHGHTMAPNSPSAAYPRALYEKFGLTQPQEQAA